MTRNRKTRKRKGGIRFRKGQLVEIKWPNKDGSFNWWKARIIDDNGGPTIIVNWIGLYTHLMDFLYMKKLNDHPKVM